MEVLINDSCIYVYIYICIYVHAYMYIYIYIERERDIDIYTTCLMLLVQCGLMCFLRRYLSKSRTRLINSSTLFTMFEADMCYASSVKRAVPPEDRRHQRHGVVLWLRTNRINTHGAAAKVMNFERFGEKGKPWHFFGGKSRLTGVPKKSLCQNT